MSPRFDRRGDAVVVTLESNEVELLRTIPDEVRSALTDPPSKDDPVYNRLFPSAYLDPTEESAEQEWQELVHPELLQSRLAALELVMVTLDRAVLRIGCYELGWQPELPTGVVISEAVELAKEYSTKDSGRFVNGMLGRIAEDLRGQEPEPPEQPAP